MVHHKFTAEQCQGTLIDPYPIGNKPFDPDLSVFIFCCHLCCTNYHTEPMIYPKHSLLFPQLFRWYSLIEIRRKFEKHEIICLNEQETDLPVLLICNHISWWDGFWMLHLNMKLWKRKFYVLMDENNLAKNKWLSYAGAFSSDRQTIRKSLNLCEEILQNRNHVLLYFPQGRLQSLYDHELKFKRGADYLIRHIGQDFTIILVANIIEYNKHKKPTIRSYCLKLRKDECTDSLEDQYRRFYDQCLNHHILHTEP